MTHHPTHRPNGVAMPKSPSHKPVEPGVREVGAPESEDLDRALHPLAKEIRLQFIFAYRRHHLARTGLPSRLRGAAAGATLGRR